MALSMVQLMEKLVPAFADVEDYDAAVMVTEAFGTIHATVKEVRVIDGSLVLVIER